jgi:hypothetical protein
VLDRLRATEYSYLAAAGGHVYLDYTGAGLPAQAQLAAHGERIDARQMRAGDFFGEHRLMAGRGTAHVVARESLTCLVLSRTPIRPDAGRGAPAPPAQPSPQSPACRGDLHGGRHQSPFTAPR